MPKCQRASCDNDAGCGIAHQEGVKCMTRRLNSLPLFPRKKKILLSLAAARRSVSRVSRSCSAWSTVAPPLALAVDERKRETGGGGCCCVVDMWKNGRGRKSRFEVDRMTRKPRAWSWPSFGNVPRALIRKGVRRRLTRSRENRVIIQGAQQGKLSRGRGPCWGEHGEGGSVGGLYRSSESCLPAIFLRFSSVMAAVTCL